MPGAPTGGSAIGTAATTTAITLTWRAPTHIGTSEITGYKIEVSPDGHVGWTALERNTESTDRTYNHTGLNVGTTRYYRVSAINSEGTGPPSEVFGGAALAMTVRPGWRQTGSVSNWHKVTNGDTSGALKTKDVSQGFLTGPCHGGYTLSAVWVRFRTPSTYGTQGDRLRITVHRDALGHDRPGDQIATLVSSSHGATTQTFPQSGTQKTFAGFVSMGTITLQPHNVYHLVLHDPEVSGNHANASTAAVDFTTDYAEANTVNEIGWKVQNWSFQRDRSTEAISSSTISTGTWSRKANSIVRFWMGWEPVDPSCKGEESSDARSFTLYRTTGREFPKIPTTNRYSGRAKASA